MPWLSTERSNIEKYLQQAAISISSESKSESCSIFLMDEPYRAVLRASTGMPTELLGKASYQAGEGLTGWVLRNQKPLVVRDFSEPTNLESIYPGLVLANKFPSGGTTLRRSFVAFPIRHESRILGVLRVTRSEPYEEAELRLLEERTAQLGRELVAISEPSSLVAPELERIYRAQPRLELLGRVNDELMASLARYPGDMHQLHHRVFEELVLELLKRDGWNAELTASTRDGGYDVVAIRSVAGVGIQLLVQAKRYARNRSVGVGLVRELYAVKHRKHATKAMLATTSHVSDAARREFRDVMPWELEFKEYEDLISWIRTYAPAP